VQIRCLHCGMPFALGKDVIHAALDLLEEQGLKFYDARCPKCRKANRISKPQLLKAAPGWSKATEVDEAETETESESENQ
jgi:phage FluMu protein Com